jgi:D-glycero-D-manno-heptose 1,7-bisphosphate phosphatase
METLENNPDIDKNWTLFLDRDGVINVESVGSYITSWEEFQFHEGVPEALQALSEVFNTIVVVSNQRGVGRGIMTMEALREINNNMCAEIAEHGGRIDKVYSCIAVSDNDHNRKPNTGMALQAHEDFPSIDFRHSVMVGNSMSDMEFGKRMAMHTVFLTTKHDPVELPHDLIDEQYPSLQSWANSLVSKRLEMVG